MNLPSDYQQARAFDGQSGQSWLAPGGHICRVIGARVEKTRTGRDMLVVAFDVEEGGDYDGFFKQRHDRAKNWNADAKWPGVFRATIMNKDGGTNGYFKGFITSVEQSNHGYDFVKSGANEGTLKGKLVGFNFGEEEYLGNDGVVKVTVKPRYAVPVETVKVGIEPPERIEYQPQGAQYGAPAPQQSAAPRADMTPQNGFTVVDNDDLPF